VKFHGVPIGKVTTISYDPAHLTRIKALLKVQESFPMKKDMWAETGAMGITGLKYVEILGGTDAAPLLSPNGEIATKTSMFTAITGKAEVIVNKIELLLNHLNSITESDSLESIKKVLSNLARITGDFQGFFSHVSPDLQGMSGSAQQLISRLDSIARDVKTMTGSINQNISSARLADIVASVDSSARSIKVLSESAALMVKQGREDFSASLQSMREALQNANFLMQELAENPSLIIRNEQQKERTIK
jgi:ABC-type transporter Mla subunit MlaD